MSKWLDNMWEDDQLDKFQEQMDLDDFQLAERHALVLLPRVLKAIETESTEFRQRFPNHQAFSGPKELTDEFKSKYLATSTLPLHKLTYRIVGTTITFEMEHQSSYGAPLEETPTVSIELKAKVGKEPWFESRGEKIMVEDASWLVLKDFLSAVKR
jgi:hypothetical protein